MARKLKSGIVGQAQVIFGGAIGMNLGWVKSARGEELAIGMAELKHPAAKAGDPIIDEETYNGTQVTLVFPDFGALNNFRYILDLLEAELKKRIAERDAQQKIDFDDAAPSHLVHEHIDPPTFEEAKCEQKPTDKVEPIEWSGKIKSRKVKGVLKEMLDEKLKPADKVEPKFKVGDNIISTLSNNPYYITGVCNGYYLTDIGCIIMFNAQDNFELVEQKPTWSELNEKIYSRICALIHSAAYKNYDVDEDGKELGEYARIINWFKSLKERVGCEVNCTTMWKPSDEQITALNYAVNLMASSESLKKTIIITMCLRI